MTTCWLWSCAPVLYARILVSQNGLSQARRLFHRRFIQATVSPREFTVLPPNNTDTVRSRPMPPLIRGFVVQFFSVLAMSYLLLSILVLSWPPSSFLSLIHTRAYFQTAVWVHLLAYMALAFSWSQKRRHNFDFFKASANLMSLYLQSACPPRSMTNENTCAPTACDTNGHLHNVHAKK